MTIDSGTPADAADRTLDGVRALVQAAQAGDREALARLFAVHEPMLLRWARRRLGRSLRTLDETRDVLHDAYQIALAKIASFQMEDNKSFARWLRGIIARVILKKAAHPYLVRRTAVDEDFQPPDLDLTPFTRLSLDELTTYRYRLLRMLPRLDRLIYRLRVRGWSSSDIADRVGLTDRAVRLRFAKTDARIRVRMRKLAEAPSNGRDP
jgi:RNA polymerase sigma factor (sigma-70 family)